MGSAPLLTTRRIIAASPMPPLCSRLPDSLSPPRHKPHDQHCLPLPLSSLSHRREARVVTSGAPPCCLPPSH
ncbi:hypothetical protein HA466_0012090 [Hirschfeldia incana]|nr:hypothetical protein HA466_0012090 [Hirschfeldia incana]